LSQFSHGQNLSALIRNLIEASGKVAIDLTSFDRGELSAAVAAQDRTHDVMAKAPDASREHNEHRALYE